MLKEWRCWDYIDNRWKEWLKLHMGGDGKVEWADNLVETFHKIVGLAGRSVVTVVIVPVRLVLLELPLLVGRLALLP